MAWNTLHSPWTTGEVVTAAEMQQITDNINFLGSTTSATVGTTEQTSGTTYGDLTTLGPAVTLTTGAKALVIVHAFTASNTVNAVTWMGVQVSGATSITVADNLSLTVINPVAGVGQRLDASVFFGNLTAGTNTFTAKYKTSSGAGTWAERVLTVIPLP